MRRLQRRSPYWKGWLLVLLVAGGSSALAAGSHTGAITVGGLPVPGAIVTATRGDRQVVGISDGEGRFHLAGLDEGPWTIRVEKLGFRTLTREIVVGEDAASTSEWALQVLQVADLEPLVRLRAGGALPGGAAADAPGLQLIDVRADAGDAGANANDAPADTPARRVSMPEAFVAGGADAFLVDGSVNNSAATPFAQPRAFGNNRPRRPWAYNLMAGTLLGNSVLDARPYSFTGHQATRPDYRDIHLLTTFGGPIQLPGLGTPASFYLGYQRTADNATSTQSARMPTVRERTGDFSQSIDAFGNLVSIVDPETGLPFPGNVIPSDRISPQAAALMEHYPVPEAGNAGRFNHQVPIIGDRRQDSFESRLSQSLTPRHRFQVTANYQRGTSDRTTLFGFSEAGRSSGFSSQTTWNHRVSPTFSWRASYQFTRRTNRTVPHFAHRRNVSGEAGITGNNQDPEHWGPPRLTFAGGIAGLSDTTHASTDTHSHVWSAQASWLSRGRHVLTFGADLRRHALDVHGQPDARGTFAFTGTVTGSDFADFLLGMPHTSTIAFGNPDKYFRGSSVPAMPPVSDVSPVTRTDLPSTLSADARFRDRRLLIFYFDRAAMGSEADRYRAFEGALRFSSEHMEPADLVAVMSYGGDTVRVRQDFTDDREQLREVLLRLLHDDDRDGDGVPDTVDDMGTPFGQNDAEFNVFNTNRQLSALQTAATMLRPLPERKTLIYFGSGLRLNASENLAQLRATINAAVRANVTINPIDARGLVAIPPLGDATRPSPGGIGMFTGALATATITRVQSSQDTLYTLARDTGGRALFDSNDLAGGIVQAAQAVTSYYIIGYYSTNTDRDGRFRRVRVTLAGGRRAELRYRDGYYADKEFARYTAAERERHLEEALMLEDPITEISLALEVNYFQINSAEYFVPVAVKLPGSELALARRRGAVRTQLDVIGEVKDDFGLTVQNVRDRLDIRLDEQTASQLADRPLQYETGFSLLPGRYEMKLLVRDATTGRIGTYQTTFAIPNLMREKQRVPISTVVLASQRVPLGAAVHEVQQQVDGHAASPLVHAGYRLLPSVTRVFSASRDLHLFFQAYQRPAGPVAPLVAYVTFYREGVKAFETRPLLQEDAPEGRADAVSFDLSLPLAGLPPGAYECQVTVIDPAAQQVAFWQAPVMVVP